VRAADPISFKEIAMLLRNRENPQFIIDEATRRKLLQPLSQEDLQTLLSLHASPALMNILRDPATIAAPQAAAAYTARVEQQKVQALREAQLAEQAAADARLQQQQQQQQASLAKQSGAAGTPPETNGAYVGKPISLKFNSADGTAVDLDQMHGKVVLIDFWATWCGPCMMKVPSVVAAYNKYHGKGFEIVGISLDKSKDSMLKVTAQKGMTWPQYFDGKGWNNEISTRFNIRAIPSMWLVNKKGLVATTEAGGNLDAEIARLLAE
jgi:thiol-disulfide isomerase/thioredoxin